MWTCLWAGNEKARNISVPSPSDGEGGESRKALKPSNFNGLRDRLTVHPIFHPILILTEYCCIHILIEFVYGIMIHPVKYIGVCIKSNMAICMTEFLIISTLSYKLVYMLHYPLLINPSYIQYNVH